MKTVLITGASGGIGAAIARAFAQAGYAVGIHYHTRQKAAEQLAADLWDQGHSAACFGADVADPEAVSRMTEAFLGQYGHCDVLVNNAGVSSFGLLQDVSDAEWRRVLDVDLSGAFYACRALLPGMIRRREGCILNISSMWGVRGAACEVAYSAAKAGLIGLTKALAKEVGPSGIRVNCIAPGVISTEMNALLSGETLAELAEETPLGRLGAPRDVADLALFLCSESAGFLTGQVILADGGFAV